MSSTQTSGSGADSGNNPKGNASTFDSNNFQNAAYANSVQLVNLVLHDVASFMRNNHSIYTAACASALSQTQNNESSGEKLLQQAEQILRLNNSYLDEVSEKCVNLLKNIKALES